MENINNNYLQQQQQTSRLIEQMTSDMTIVARDEFRKIVSSPDALRKLAVSITSNLDLFIRIISTEGGSCRVSRMLGISEEINTILFNAIIKRFTEIMTHKNRYILGLKIMCVCDVHQINLFCSVMLRDAKALVLSRSEYGCVVLKLAMTTADDRFKDEFLNLIAKHAFWLTRDNLGKSLIKHVVELNFTHKTTQDKTRLHELIAEFDDILKTSHKAELHKLVLKLTSDSNLFVDFVRTRRGSLLVQLILGKSEEIDTVLLEAIKHRLMDVITIKFTFGYKIVTRLRHVFMDRGNFEVDRQILNEVAWKALYLTKNNYPSSTMVESAIRTRNEHHMGIIESQLHGHYVELSFLQYGSNVVKTLVVEGESLVALSSIVMEIVKCDEDTLVRMAMDEYGNQVLKEILEFAKKKHRADLFGDLVEKLKPLSSSVTWVGLFREEFFL